MENSKSFQILKRIMFITVFEHCTGRPTCAAGQFRCGTGQCIAMTQRCDNNFDCADMSDEKSCGKNNDSVNRNITIVL